MRRLRDGSVVGIVTDGSGMYVFNPNSARIRSSSVSAPGSECHVVRCEIPRGGGTSLHENPEWSKVNGRNSKNI
jgi:hypothetical protein